MCPVISESKCDKKRSTNSDRLEFSNTNTGEGLCENWPENFPGSSYTKTPASERLGRDFTKCDFFPAACMIALCPSCRNMEYDMKNKRNRMETSFKNPCDSLIRTQPSCFPNIQTQNTTYCTHSFSRAPPDSDAKALMRNSSNRDVTPPTRFKRSQFMSDRCQNHYQPDYFYPSMSNERVSVNYNPTIPTIPPDFQKQSTFATDSPRRSTWPNQYSVNNQTGSPTRQSSFQRSYYSTQEPRTSRLSSVDQQLSSPRLSQLSARSTSMSSPERASHIPSVNTRTFSKHYSGATGDNSCISATTSPYTLNGEVAVAGLCRSILEESSWDVVCCFLLNMSTILKYAITIWVGITVMTLIQKANGYFQLAVIWTIVTAIYFLVTKASLSCRSR